MHGMTATVSQTYQRSDGTWFDGWNRGYRTEIMLHPDVLVVPVAIVTFRKAPVMTRDFGPEAEALLDYLPVSWPHVADIPVKDSVPAPGSIGLPPDDIWGACDRPIQFQSVGHWFVTLPEGWLALPHCDDGYVRAWLPSYRRQVDSSQNPFPILPEILAAEYGSSPDELDRIQAVFGTDPVGPFEPSPSILRPPVLRIGQTPSTCPMAAGHTSRDPDHEDDGIDLVADNATVGGTVLQGNTVAHELGHVLGLEHMNVSGNLMQRSGDPLRDVTLTTEQCAQAIAYAQYWNNTYRKWLAHHGVVSP